MNILRVISSMKPEGGGPAQGIRNSIPEMTRHGVINEVLCFDSGEESYCGSDSFEIHYLGAAKGPYQYHSGLKSWLSSNLGNYDAVVIHGLWLYNSYGTYSAWRAYKKLHLKAPQLFVMPHGMLDPYFQQAKGRRLKALRNSVIWHLLEKHVINHSDGVLFTCEQELLLARETFRDYHPSKEINVGYGVPKPMLLEEGQLERVFQEHFAALTDQPYWLFLSRIHEKKGVDLLISAYLKLKKDCNDLSVLVIAGPGIDTAYGEELLMMTNGDPQIHFTGMVKGDGKWALLQKASVFILPSHQENFGIAIVEAMACATPVLITRQVNIYKEIEEGEGGLVSEDQEDSVYEMLLKWYRMSASSKQEMSAKAQEVYLQKFSIESASAKFIDELKEMRE